MSLTKARLIDSICNQCGFSKNKSVVMMETILETIKETLVAGEDVLISGFGKFCTRGKSQRRGRNPATGTDLMLEARRVVTYRCSEVLRASVNRKV